MLQVRLLAQFDVRADGKRVIISARAAQSLFAFLILNPNVAHRREKLAGMLWADMPEENARHNLRQELWRLRKALALQESQGGDYLLADELTIAFNGNAEHWLDVAQLTRETPDASTGELLSQVSLYRGELLPGFYDDWVLLERERVQALYERKMQTLLERLIAEQQWHVVLEWAERWIALGDTPEPAYRAQMVAHNALGNSSQVALAYERCVEALRNELGVEPSADTRALYEQLARGDANARAIVAPLPSILVQPSGTVTFMFTDIEGSTKLLERLGNEYAKLLEEHYDLFRALGEKHNGHEIDTQGDAFFFAFFRAADAVSFAADAQRALAAHSWPQNVNLRVRMGLHTGEPMLARTGYVGMDVHRAARIGAAGHGGQVLMSRTTRDLVENDLPNGTHLTDLGEHQLKDLRYPVHIVQLSMDDLPSEFPPLKVLNTGSEPPAPGEPPFKGLQFFDESDAALFFGREQTVAQLRDALAQNQFLAVVIGASGSGKSSIVRAGLIPALKNGDGRLETGDWKIFVMTPTAHPLEALATVLTRDVESVTATATLIDDLAKDPRSLHLWLRRQTADDRPQDSGRPSSAVRRHALLVIDQFEELFTLCHDEYEREAFIDNLLYALEQSTVNSNQSSVISHHSPSPNHPFTPSPVHPLTVVLTLRADFYAHLAQYPELRAAVAKRQEYIGPMNAEELRRAIVEPANRGGWELEAGLVDLMLRDVGDEPGALPLLSHALLETWKRRSGHLLTLKGYHEAGGVRGAIAHTAETTYQQLSPEQQDIARAIFLRLTELGDATEDTRRRAEIGELEIGDFDRAQVRHALTLLADARLITTSEHTVEVAHEALIREWPRLREWLNQDREGLKLHRNLTEAAQEWELLERDAGALYRGARLAQAQEFALANPNALNVHERAFLDASEENERKVEREREEARQRELLVKEQLLEMEVLRVEQEQVANQRLRQRAVFLAGALVLALVLTGIALFLGDAANRNAASAQQNASVAEQNASAANTARLNAEQEKRIARARELAASSKSSLDGDPERSVLLALEAIKATAPDNLVLPEAQTALHQAVLANRLERMLNGHEQKLFFVKYTPDGSRIITNSIDGTIRMWDPASGQEVGKLSIAPGWVSRLDFNADGTRLGVTDIENDSSFAKIWDIRSGELVKKFDLKIPADKWWDQAYNRDFSRVVVTSTDGAASVYDVATGERLFTFPIGKDVNCGVTYSPDASRIAAGCSDGSASVHDATTGRELFKLCCHSQSVNQIVYSPDGTRIGTASNDWTGKVWDAFTGKELLALTGTAVNFLDIAFSRDGSLIATNSNDGHPRVYDAKTGIEQLELLGHTGFGRGVAFSPDGTRLVSANEDRTARIWDITPNKEALAIPITSLAPDFYFGTLFYSPDGTRIAYGQSDGTIRIWETANGKLVSTLHGHSGYVNRISFSADGKRLASASDDKTAKVWDLASGKELATFTGHTTGVMAVAFRPDGKRVASGGRYPDQAVRIWDADNGNELNEFKMPPAPIFDLKFSPDGKHLAVGTATNNSFYTGGSVHVLDAATGAPLFSPVNNEATYEIDYSPDGKHLAITDSGIVAKVFDALTGKEVLTLRGLNSTPISIAYANDGKRLATVNADSSVTVWDAASGEIIFTIYDKSLFSSQSIAFSPDGTRVATGDLNGIRIYFTQTQDLVAIAKTRVTRALTQEECSKYLHVAQCPQNQ